jgi:hypothetical protein
LQLDYWLTMLDPTQPIKQQHEKIRDQQSTTPNHQQVLDCLTGFPEWLRCKFGSWGLQTFTWRMPRSWSTSTALRGSLASGDWS